MKQRETIDQAIEENIFKEIKTARISWDGKQFVVRFPSIISDITKITNKDKIKFEFNYKTEELKLNLIRGAKK